MSIPTKQGQVVRIREDARYEDESDQPYVLRSTMWDGITPDDKVELGAVKLMDWAIWPRHTFRLGDLEVLAPDLETYFDDEARAATERIWDREEARCLDQEESLNTHS